MIRILAVFLGGGLGSIFRYYLGLRLNLTYGNFPYGTLLANVLSSILLGVFLAQYITNPQWKDHYRLLVMTGFCGGFSTFSTFSGETVLMMRNGETGLAFIYLFVSLVLGLLGIYLGMKIMENT